MKQNKNGLFIYAVISNQAKKQRNIERIIYFYRLLIPQGIAPL